MTDAPERIWLDNDKNGIGWTDSDREAMATDLRYDLHRHDHVSIPLEALREVLEAAKPIADHAEAWERVGLGQYDTLVESHWDGGPVAEDGEPEYFGATFLTVGHLQKLRAAIDKLMEPE